MKKSLAILLIVVSLVALILCACTTKNNNEVVITIDKKYDFSLGNTLADYMDYLAQKGTIQFEIEDGMVVAINGVRNSLNSYWMLYTNDSAFSNTSWGSYQYKDTTFGSASVGANALAINTESTYIWVYQTF